MLVAVALAIFVFPERTNELKLILLLALLSDFATALWLLVKGLQPGGTAEARA